MNKEVVFYNRSLDSIKQDGPLSLTLYFTVTLPSIHLASLETGFRDTQCWVGFVYPCLYQLLTLHRFFGLNTGSLAVTVTVPLS